MKPHARLHLGSEKKADSSLGLEHELKTNKVAEVGKNWIIKALHEMLKTLKFN